MAVKTVRMSVAQGQVAGNRSRRLRAPWVRRAGTCSNRYRSAFGSQVFSAVGRASSRSQAMRSAAIEVAISHAWLIAYSREGNRPMPVSFACRIRVSTLLVHGVRAVAGLEERDLPPGGQGGVGRDGLVAPPVGVLEQRQRAPGWGCSRRIRTRIPGGHVVTLSMPVISTTLPFSRASPSGSIAGAHAFFGTLLIASRTLSVTANPTWGSPLWGNTPRCGPVSRSTRSASRAAHGTRRPRQHGPASSAGAGWGPARWLRSTPRCGRRRCSSRRSRGAASPPATPDCYRTRPRAGGSRSPS